MMLRFIKKFITRLAFLVVSFVAIFVIASVAIIHLIGSDLPDHNSLKLYYPNLSSRVFLSDGSLLTEYASEKRYFIPIQRIPQKLINAFLVVEDTKFYTHSGIDPLRIAKSLILNLLRGNHKKRPKGASTITQQIARIFLLGTNEVSYKRKIREAILAFRIENALNKSQILELYLNQIYLGLGAYGIAAAAKIYFAKSVDDLTLAECAYIASLAKGANNYHPIKNHKRAILRRNWALERLQKNGFISAQECEESKKEDLTLSKDAILPSNADYFAEELRKALMQMMPTSDLNKKGLVIRATLDNRLQKCAEAALLNGLENFDKRLGWKGPIGNIDISENTEQNISEVIINLEKQFTIPHNCKLGIIKKVTNQEVNGTFADGTTFNAKVTEWTKKPIKCFKIGDIIPVDNSNPKKTCIKQIPRVQGGIVVIEVNTGRVLAMHGGYNFKQSKFNRVTQAMRQCGSAFKPFVYLAALENGISPADKIDGSPCEIDIGYGLGIWSPKNYKNKTIGIVTVRQGLEKSLNTVTVRLAQNIGLKKIANISQKFGLFDKMPLYFSSVLGSVETTLLKLTSAYAMIANGGRRIVPTLIDYIQDRNGKVVFKADNRGNLMYQNADLKNAPPKLLDVREQLSDPASTYQLISMMCGVVERGSAIFAKQLGYPIAGKTGTSNDSHDAWFIGATTDIVVGIFIGYDDYTSLGENVTGSSIAVPIFVEFMSSAIPKATAKPFKIPNGIVFKNIDRFTGEQCNKISQNIITEAFKDDSSDESKQIQNVAHSIDLQSNIDISDDDLQTEDTTTDSNYHQMVYNIPNVY